MEKAISIDGKYIATANARPFNGKFQLSKNADSAQRGVEIKIDFFIDAAVYENKNGELGDVVIPSLSMRLMEARSTRNPNPSLFYVGADNDAPEGGNSARRKSVKFSDSIWNTIKKAMGAAIDNANKSTIAGTGITSNTDLCIDASLWAQAAKMREQQAATVVLPPVAKPTEMPASNPDAEKTIQEFEQGQAGA